MEFLATVIFFFFSIFVSFFIFHISTYRLKKDTLDVEIVVFDAITSNVNTEENSLNVDVVQ